MNKDYTDITVVLDRSGSMFSCASDAEGGLNALIEDQKKQPGSATFTLVKFDDRYEVAISAAPIQTVTRQYVEPRGGTALLDAVGKAVTDTGARLNSLPESERPGLVIVAIITDGQENCSREFSREGIKQLVQHQESTYSWKFTFLGANQDAFAEAGSIGINVGATAAYRTANTGATYASMSSNITRARKMSASGVSASCVLMDYDDKERKSMVEDS